MTRATLKNISINEAQLEGLRLDKTHFEKVSFDGNDMRNFDLDGLSMSLCSFADCKFAGMEINGCDFFHVDLRPRRHARHQAHRATSIKPPYGKPTSIRPSKASKERSLFENALKAPTDWRKFEECTTGATLDNALLINADLRESMLDKINAFETSFQNAKLWYADLSHANVSGADFSMAHCTFTNLHNVKTRKQMGPRRHARNKRPTSTDWKQRLQKRGPNEERVPTMMPASNRGVGGEMHFPTCAKRPRRPRPSSPSRSQT